MQIKSKLLLSFAPVLLLIMGAIGYISYKFAASSMEKHEYELLGILAEQATLASIHEKYALLARSGLEEVDVFKTSYQQEVYAELQDLASKTSKDFAIINTSTNEVIFETLQQSIKSYNLDNIEQARLNKVKANFGRMSSTTDTILFACVEFAPWHWEIFVVEPYERLKRPLDNIAKATLISLIIALLFIVLGLSSVSEKLIFSRIITLRNAAKRIAENSEVVSLKMGKSDEIGQLATDMEIMSHKIRQTLDKADSASQAKSDFLAVMSHEIRTPLNGIIGMTNLLSDTNVDDTQKGYLKDLLASSEGLKSLVNDVLDMARIESGNLQFESIPIDFTRLISKVFSIFKVAFSEHKNQLIIDKDLPVSKVISADIVAIRQIMINLISNANKFTNDGTIKLSVKISEAGEGPSLIIIVKDDGIGIPKDKLDTVFDTFTQSDNSITRKYGGSGLGLSIIERLVKAMAGKITLKSTLGKGTEVKVIVPVKVESKEYHHNAQDTLDSIKLPKALHVLLVEDNEINATVARVNLEDIACTVEHVSDGSLAVEAANKKQFDIILMDVHMPNMNGIEATKIIREGQTLNAETPIIGLTAEAFKEKHVEFMTSGMNSVLSKPFDKQALVREFKKVLKLTH
ncbi:ATP-binding protein [Agaribacter marinus]|nr:ATP-binding protein [Agaribacter marinus]